LLRRFQNTAYRQRTSGDQPPSKAEARLESGGPGEIALGGAMKGKFFASAAAAALMLAGFGDEARAQAQAPQAQPEPSGTDAPVSSGDTGAPPAEAAEPIEEVVITGSLIRRAPTVSVAEYGREDFVAEGSPTIDALLDRNPIQYAGFNKSDQNYLGGVISGIKSVNLRGLYRTLPLFNGRRMLTGGGISNQGYAPVDVGMLPLVALDRVETLRSGGSTLYGSDAIAGVWNFITRDNFDGLELMAEHQYYEGGGETTLGAIVGVQGDRVRWTAAVEYYDADVLRIDERRPLVRYGNPAEGGWNTGFSSVSFPGVVSLSPNGVANARVDPLCGRLTGYNPLISSWVANPTTCRWSFVGYNNFVDNETRHKFYTQVSADVTENVEVYSSFIWSASDVEWNTVPHYPNNNIGSGHSPSALHYFIPRDNPGYNAFLAALPAAERPVFDAGVPIDPANPASLRGLWIRARPDIFSEPRKSGPREREWKQLVFGVRGDLPFDLGFVKNLSYDVSAMYQQRDFFISGPDTLTDRYKLALVGLGGPSCRPPSPDPFSPLNAPFRNNAAQGCYAWNPFGNAAVAAPGSPEDNRADVQDWFIGDSQADQDAESSTVDVLLRGETGLVLPGGPVAFAVGAQSLIFDEDVRFPGDNGVDGVPRTPPFVFLGFNSPKQYDVTSHRKSVFGELAVPLLENLDIQLAVRREDYEINAQTAPRVAFAWKPLDWITVRGGYERAFSIPTAAFESVNLESFLSVNQNDFLPRTVRFSAGLNPEVSDNIELGLVLRPIDNLLIDLNYYRFELQGLVGTEALAYSELLVDPANPTRFIGAISDLVNGPDVVTDGVDFSVSYNREFMGGEFGATLDGVWLSKYDLLIPATPAVPAVGPLPARPALPPRTYNAGGFYNTRSSGSPVGIGSYPEWKFNVGLSYEYGPHTISGLMRYISGYDLHPTVADCCMVGSIDADVRYDLFYTLRLFDENTRLTFSIINVTDEDPPLAPQELGYDSSTHNPLTRSFKVTLTQRFGGR
jgi:iron complex outermembrane receptor protein